MITDPERGEPDESDRPRTLGPKARSKWLTGSVQATAAEVVAAVLDQAEHRDPGHHRPWVVLVDGARHQLELIQAEARRRKADVHIVIDIIHVLEYLWSAAWALHENGDPHAETWVAHHARTILAGHAEQTAATMTAQADTAGLEGRGCPESRGSSVTVWVDSMRRAVA